MESEGEQEEENCEDGNEEEDEEEGDGNGMEDDEEKEVGEEEEIGMEEDEEKEVEQEEENGVEEEEEKEMEDAVDEEEEKAMEEEEENDVEEDQENKVEEEAENEMEEGDETKVEEEDDSWYRVKMYLQFRDGQEALDKQILKLAKAKADVEIARQNLEMVKRKKMVVDKMVKELGDFVYSQFEIKLWCDLYHYLQSGRTAADKDALGRALIGMLNIYFCNGMR